MYKYLLCWRYLKTRYIALASVISVMLGVATMIVVNSVMAGFADKMRDRLHGVLADVDIESFTLNGFYDWKEVMARIEQAAGKDILAMAPTMECPGIIHFRVNGEVWNRPVQLIGITPEERARTGDFAEFLFDSRAIRSPPRSTCPRRTSSRPGRGDAPGLQVRPERRVRQALPGGIEEGEGGAGPRPGRHPRLCAATFHQKGHEDIFIAPPGTKVRLLFPRFGQTKSEAGFDDVHHRRLFQERHERV